MFAMICSAFVPSWRGLPLPEPMTRLERLWLALSMVWAELAALRYHGRTFGTLSPSERESLLGRLLDHPRAAWRVRARRWKEIALLTA